MKTLDRGWKRESSELAKLDSKPEMEEVEED